MPGFDDTVNMGQVMSVIAGSCVEVLVDGILILCQKKLFSNLKTFY